MFTTVLYLTGDPAALSYDDSVLRTWTILNSAAITWKVVTVYFICLVFVTAMVLYMIFTYMVKYQAVDNAFEEQEEEDATGAVEVTETQQSQPAEAERSASRGEFSKILSQLSEDSIVVDEDGRKRSQWNNSQFGSQNFNFASFKGYATLAAPEGAEAHLTPGERQMRVRKRSIRKMKKISRNPLDYGMKRYTDLQIANHCIMIENLPTELPRAILEQKLHQAFQKVLGYDPSANKVAEDIDDELFKEIGLTE